MKLKILPFVPIAVERLQSMGDGGFSMFMKCVKSSKSIQSRDI